MEILKVLIVDDELGMLEGIKRILDAYQIPKTNFDTVVALECFTADNDETALNLLRTEKFDLLLLDYKLQNLTGLEILEIIKKEKIEVLTIMITAFASLETAVSATKQGAFDFIAKPFTPSELKSSLNKAIDHLFFTRKARQLEREKKQQRFLFISVLAHELKSPIAAVEGYLNIMEARIKGDSIDNYEDMILKSITRLQGMRKLILDILDLTKIESGKKQSKPENINVLADLQDALDDIKEYIRKLNLKVKINVDENLEFYIDKTDFEVIVHNLLSNAAKYNKQNGKIEVTINKTDNNGLIIKCADTGIGIAPEDLKRLFNEFTRIKNEKTRYIEGSGLGLSILKKTVALYNGKIDVQSKENEGSVFTITLYSQPSTT